MGGPKGHQRGRKTHKADMKVNRGEPEEPKPDEPADDEKGESRREEQARDEHPARMTERGYRSGVHPNTK